MTATYLWGTLIISFPISGIITIICICNDYPADNTKEVLKLMLAVYCMSVCAFIGGKFVSL